MHSFRLRLILALIAGVTLLSVASTYFEVLEHKHILRQELEWRSAWIGTSLSPQIETALAQGNTRDLASIALNAKMETGALGIGIYDPAGKLITSVGAQAVFEELAHSPFESLAKKTPVGSLAQTEVQRSIKKGSQVNAFGHTKETQWLEEAFPLHDGNRLVGALVVLVDSGYIRDQGYDVWRRSFGG